MWTYLSAENFKKWHLDRDIGNEEDSIRKKMPLCGEKGGQGDRASVLRSNED